MVTIRVASKTSVAELSETIFSSLDSNGEVELKAIGAGAVNQSVKAAAIASKTHEIKLIIIPSFFSTSIGEEERTGIKLLIRKEN